MRQRTLLASIFILLLIPVTYASLEYDLAEGDVDNKQSNQNLSFIVATEMKWTPAQLFLEITNLVHGGYVTIMGTASGGGAQQETLVVTANGVYESTYFYIAVDELVFHAYGCTFHFRLYQDPSIKGSGYFVLSVHVKQGPVMLKDATVTVKPLGGSREAEVNQSTNYLGVAQFELTYGSYLVQASHENKLKTMRVLLSETKSVGFEFPASMQKARVEGFVFGCLAGMVSVLLFWRVRR
jgi:hypothetical protein